MANYGNELTKKFKHKFVYSLTTNATLVDDAFIKFCKKNKIAVILSIDGKESVHDLNRLTNDNTKSFNLIIDNIKKCIKSKVSCMAAPVICVNNVNYLSDTVRYLIDIGFKRIQYKNDFVPKISVGDFPVLVVAESSTVRGWRNLHKGLTIISLLLNIIFSIVFIISGIKYKFRFDDEKHKKINFIELF
ncbi:MAG: hypothetical protein IJ220_00545 [Clostridia bacterium]|nr:hypothetical protein [Clostridia bacterium]